jgi:uncharacterized membrane protein (UPF0136 family)
MTDDKPGKAMKAELLRAAILEMLCLVAGLLAWSLTGSWVWIAAGVLAGLGFSLPAIIRLVREAREQDRASR